jgi:general secretion pathway protein L
MADGMIFWLAPDGGPSAGGWLRVVGGRVVQRGEGSEWRAATGLVALPAEEAAMLIVPSGEVALHWIACPGMTVRQGSVAAPLMALEASIGPAEALHGAVAPALDPEQPHIVAVAARAAMERWIAFAEAAGAPQAAIVPAALLLPPPEEGFVLGRIGGESVLRGTDSAAGAAEPHAPLILADAPLQEIADKTVEEGLAAALAHPPMTLRQGSYALRRATALDPAWLRRVAALAGCVALVALLASLVTIVRLHWEASSLDANSLALAREVAPEATDLTDAEARLTAKLALRGGGSGGFTGTTAGILGAMEGAPGVTMTSLSQLADGSVRAQLSASRSEDINVALIALQNAGWRVAANGVQQQGAQVLADISVVP